MKWYINRFDTRDSYHGETVSEYEDKESARKDLAEYRFSEADVSQVHYELSTKPRPDWDN